MSLQRTTIWPHACLLLALATTVSSSPAVEPIHRFEATPTPTATLSLTQSAVADQLQWVDLPYFSFRGHQWLGAQLAYRDKRTGVLKPTWSGEEPVRILDDSRPWFSDAIFEREWGIACLPRSFDELNGLNWVRSIEFEVSPEQTTQPCQNVVQTATWQWARVDSTLRFLASDGQIKATVPIPELQFNKVLSAYALPVSNTLLAIVAGRDGEPLRLYRVETSGETSHVDLPTHLRHTLQRFLVTHPAGGWGILVGDGQGTPHWVHVSADFDTVTATPLSSKVIPTYTDGTPNRDHDIQDFYWLDGNRFLLNIAVSSDYYADDHTFRVLEVATTGQVTPLVQGGEGDLAQRFFPLADQGSQKRTVLITLEQGALYPPWWPMNMTLRLFKDRDIVYTRRLEVSVNHQLTGITESGELLLAEKFLNRVRVSLLTATGTVLESGSMPSPVVYDSMFIQHVADGHYRMQYVPVGDDYRIRLSKHATNGRLVWQQTLPLGSKPEVQVDDTAACAAIDYDDSEVACYDGADGHLLSQITVRCQNDFTNLPEVQRRALELFCQLTPTSTITRAERVVHSARPEHRASNGDALWSNGQTVHRYNANAELLNQFGTGELSYLWTDVRVPLRFVADGSYVFARSEQEAGTDGLAVYRVDTAGQVIWRHFEPSTSVNGYISDTPRDAEPLEIVGNQVALRIYQESASAEQVAIELYLNVVNGQVSKRVAGGVIGEWGIRVPTGDRVIEVYGGEVRSRNALGDLIASYHFTAPPELIRGTGEVSKREHIRVRPGLVDIAGFVYPDPASLPAYRLDQSLLDGQWAVDRPMAINGEGIHFDYLEPVRLLFGTWATYAPNANWQESDLRWLTMLAEVPTAASSVTLGIYETRGGVFGVSSNADTRRVGSAVLKLESCDAALLTAEFDQGEYAGIVLERILTRERAWDQACASVDQTPVPRPVRSAFGFDTRQTGTYLMSGPEAQGLLAEVRPDVGPRGEFHAMWFSADPIQQQDDVSGQFWVTLEGELAPSESGRIALKIIRSNGGDPIGWAPINGKIPKVTRNQIGTAVLEFTGCNLMQLQYQFDDTDLAGRFRGLQGSNALQGFGECPN